MAEAHAQRSVSLALIEICRFCRLLLAGTATARIMAASGLILLGGLAEGVGLVLLVPLLQTLDSSAGADRSWSSWLDAAFRLVGIRPGLVGLLGLFMLLVIARSFLLQLRNLVLYELKLDLIREARVRLYSAIARAGWPFLRQNRRSDYLTALTSETDRLDQAVHFALETPSRAVMIGAHVIAACAIAPGLSLGALSTGFLLAWLVRGRLLESLRIGAMLSRAYKEFYHEISEFLAGLEITKSLVAEERYIAAFASRIDDVNRQLASYVSAQSKARLFQEIAGAFAVALFVWIGAEALGLPSSEVLALVLIFYRLLPLVLGLQQSLQQLLHMSSAVRAVADLLAKCDAAREQVDLREAPITRLRVGVRVENIGFRHRAEHFETLNDLDLQLPANSLTVLIGPSGAGKTTLLQLLAGLLRPDRGRIVIDERELTGALVPAWRRSISYVSQDPFLFHDTIRANLLIADPAASESELYDALHAAGADFVRDLPQGLDTIVGDRGFRFSGGERQRLALARALSRRPALLVLDEPTSSLDEQSERKVLMQIEALRGRVTMIMATHRPERVRCADQVLCLRNGRLEAAPSALEI